MFLILTEKMASMPFTVSTLTLAGSIPTGTKSMVSPDASNSGSEPTWAKPTLSGFWKARSEYDITSLNTVPADHPLAIRLAMAIPYGVFVPSVAIYYHRNAFIFKGARDVRVTLDHNLLALPPRTPTASLPRILPSDPHDQFLVEIKGNGWMPVEVVDAICRNNLVAGSFSKYCAGVERAYHLPPHG